MSAVLTEARQRTEAGETEASILSRLFNSQADMAPEAARYLLSLRFAESDIDRMNDLSERVQTGEIRADELSELDAYLHVDALVGLLWSRARQCLKASAAD